MSKKKVIYLDQFAFSNLYRVRAGRNAGPHHAFWEEALELINRVLLLQQAIFPHSDVHHSETIVVPWAQDLRDLYEGFSGEVSFEDTSHIQLRQIGDFADAFISGDEPAVCLEVDGILSGTRNAWLPDMRVSVNTDYSQFAEPTRMGRVESGASIAELMESWRRRGLGFDDVLEIELGSYHTSRIDALRHFHQKIGEALVAEDLMAELNLSMSLIVREMSMLRDIFKRAGVPEEAVFAETQRFWQWPRNREQPFGRILAYLFAALAGQVKAGRKPRPQPSFMNDARAISAYAPYVDAMFLDKECAVMLTQGRPGSELRYRARIFSLNTKDEFLSYLRGLEAATPEEVRRYAGTIYGI